MATEIDQGIILHQQKLDELFEHRLEELEKWKAFLSDYEVLEQRLTTLPDSTKHEIMVPFGPLAFMPGKIVHTNEVLVLLGDNLFAERSAKQAIEIIRRRQKYVKGNIEQVKVLVSDLGTRVQYSRSELAGQARDEEGNDIMEIREELTAEDEKLLEEHIHARYKVKDEVRPKVLATQRKTKTPEEIEEDRAIIKMLEEAEREERRLDELDRQGLGSSVKEAIVEVEEGSECEEKNDLEGGHVEIEEVDEEDIKIYEKKEPIAYNESTRQSTSRFKQAREQQRTTQTHSVPEVLVKPELSTKGLHPAAFTREVIERDIVETEEPVRQVQPRATEKVSRFKAAMRKQH